VYQTRASLCFAPSRPYRLLHPVHVCDFSEESGLCAWGFAIFAINFDIQGAGSLALVFIGFVVVLPLGLRLFLLNFP